MSEKMLSPTEAAAVLGVSKQTLRTLRANGNGPGFIQFNMRVIHYPESDLLAFLAARTHGGWRAKPARSGA